MMQQAFAHVQDYFYMVFPTVTGIVVKLQKQGSAHTGQQWSGLTASQLF